MQNNVLNILKEKLESYKLSRRYKEFYSKGNIIYMKREKRVDKKNKKGILFEDSYVDSIKDGSVYRGIRKEN
ncbi:MAG: hypothetical protein RR922_05245 [Clostridia bacterium]